MLSVIKLRAVMRYAECHYAECHYAKCHCAECRGAASNQPKDTISSLSTKDLPRNPLQSVFPGLYFKNVSGK